MEKETLILDTAPIIEFLRRPDKKDIIFTSLVRQKYKLAISMMTHTELYAGKSIWAGQRAKKELDNLCSGMITVPVTIDISVEAGRLKAAHNMGVADAIIAATAGIHRRRLVTLNTKHFSKIPGLKLFAL